MVRKIITVTSAVLFFFVLISASPSLAVNELDMSFGTEGKVVEDFGFGDDEILDVAAQEDGKILVAGYAYNGAVQNVVVARYLPDGVLDTDFNDDGIFSVSLGDGDCLAQSIVLQSDGKPVVAASTANGDGNGVVLLRLTTDGFLDMTFGEEGQASVLVDDDAVESVQLKQGSEGQIVVAGTASSEAAGDYVYISKFTSNGEVDEGFGEYGFVAFEKDEPVSLNTFEILSDDKILGASSHIVDGHSQVSLIRWNSDGQLDADFGEEGENSLGLEGVDIQINDSQLDGRGNIYLAGGLGEGASTTSFVVKVNSVGDLVSDFGEGGMFLSDLESQSIANDMILLEGGKILIVGFIDGDNGKDIFVQTIERTGVVSTIESDEEAVPAETEHEITPMTEKEETVTISAPAEEEAAAETSYVSTDFFSSDDIGYAAAALPGGGVVVAGSSQNGSDTDFALASYSGEELVAGASGGGSEGVVFEGYRIVTVEVVDVTRVSAVSGGSITDTQTLSCETSCTRQCGEGNDDCIDDCVTECEERPTVTTRGVVWSISSLPVYDEGEEDEDDGNADDVAEEDPNGNIFPQGEPIEYPVRSGQTEDGEGIGAYTSEILGITPDTTYYVRAYAILSDETVIYGNVVSFKTSDACFIATAAFGSVFERHVTVLREFRDTFLMDNRPGRFLVAMYYTYSPTLAEFIEKSEILRAVVRMVLAPVVAVAAFVLNCNVPLAVYTVVGLALLIALGKNSRRFIRIE